MAEIPKELKGILFCGGAKRMSRLAWVVGPLGIVFIIVGIIGDATNRVPGLEPTSWFLIAIALCVWCLGAWTTAYYAAKEGEK